jgi:hypothetical protein
MSSPNADPENSVQYEASTKLAVSGQQARFVSHLIPAVPIGENIVRYESLFCLIFPL